jgi:hypothetical protein
MSHLRACLFRAVPKWHRSAAALNQRRRHFLNAVRISPDLRKSVFRQANMAARIHRDDGRGRRAGRLALDEAARLRPNSWSSTEVRVVNLSASGFRAECEARVAVGSWVSLDMPGLGSVDAQVEWQRRNLFGAKFLQPISLDRCGWAPLARKPVLAQLLLDRAAASEAGRAALGRPNG